MAGHPLGQEDRVVDVEVATGEAAETAEQAGHPLRVVLAPQQVGGGDRAGVDHRVEGPVTDGVEHDRVERLAGGLDADALEHALAPVVLERQAVDERLRDRLQREQAVGVADVEALALGGDHADREPGGVGARELGDVVGDAAFVHLARLLEDLFERAAQRRHRGARVTQQRVERAGVTRRSPGRSRSSPSGSYAL